MKFSGWCGTHLQPAMIRLDCVVEDDNFVLHIARSASVVSVSNLLNITMHHIDIKLYAAVFAPAAIRDW